MFICYFYISVETLIFAKVLEQTRLKNIEFMKTMNYSLIRILFALVIGLVLVIWPNAAASYIVITVGVAFLIPGVISLFGYFGRKRQEGEAAPRFPIEGILKGKRACAYPCFEDHLEGAAVTAGPVEVDGNVITSRGMGTSIPFGLAIAGVFCGQDKADACAHAIVFQP